MAEVETRICRLPPAAARRAAADGALEAARRHRWAVAAYLADYLADTSAHGGGGLADFVVEEPAAAPVRFRVAYPGIPPGDPGGREWPSPHVPVSSERAARKACRYLLDADRVVIDADKITIALPDGRRREARAPAGGRFTRRDVGVAVARALGGGEGYTLLALEPGDLPGEYTAVLQGD